jgi:hypothetical protein
MSEVVFTFEASPRYVALAKKLEEVEPGTHERLYMQLCANSFRTDINDHGPIQAVLTISTLGAYLVGLGIYSIVERGLILRDHGKKLEKLEKQLGTDNLQLPDVGKVSVVGPYWSNLEFITSNKEGALRVPGEDRMIGEADRHYRKAERHFAEAEKLLSRIEN